MVNECLASLGLVRGVPDAEFHERLSALRERAQEAGRGFLSIKVQLGHKAAGDVGDAARKSVDLVVLQVSVDPVRATGCLEVT